MKILYIGYWGLNDGLSRSTIQQNLKILSRFKVIDEIYFITIERESKSVDFDWAIDKIRHVPYYTSDSHSIYRKIGDFFGLVIKAIFICNKNEVKHIICRSSLAGIVGLIVSRLISIQYSVESFEPHAEYMVEANVWKRNGLKYKLQKFFEDRQLRTAKHIFPVSYGFKRYLEKENPDLSSLKIIPCVVDTKKFQFSETDRETIRKMLSIEKEQFVLLYLGKFGDIYYEDESYSFIAEVLNSNPMFSFIILSPVNKKVLLSKLKDFEIPLERCYVNFVDHRQIPAYLSAADIAVSFVKSSLWSFACSPIKTGEYWSSGLPVIMEDNIGDDSALQSEIAPNLIHSFKYRFNEEVLTEAKSIDRMNNSFVALAREYRSIDYVSKAYSTLIDSLIL